jgi:hypothetical protein
MNGNQIDQQKRSGIGRYISRDLDTHRSDDGDKGGEDPGIDDADTLITQISQVIQGIHDIKGNKILSGNKYNSRQNMKSIDPAVQKEHARSHKAGRTFSRSCLGEAEGCYLSAGGEGRSAYCEWPSRAPT